MIEVGMKNQKFSDACFIDMEFFELFQDLGDKITQSSAYDHGLGGPLQEVDTRFLSA